MPSTSSQELDNSVSFLLTAQPCNGMTPSSVWSECSLPQLLNLNYIPSAVMERACKRAVRGLGLQGLCQSVHAASWRHRVSGQCTGRRICQPGYMNPLHCCAYCMCTYRMCHKIVIVTENWQTRLHWTQQAASSMVQGEVACCGSAEMNFICSYNSLLHEPQHWKLRMSLLYNHVINERACTCVPL